MAIVRLLKNAVSFREFYGRPGKPVYHGTCGETALSSAITAASAKPTSHTDAVNQMLDITEELIGRKDADASGATTISALLGAAQRRGWGIVHYEGYQEPLSFDWHSFLLGPDGAGVNPVIFEVAQAYNLKDTQGSADEAGVHYHFITVVGVNADGYICCDGDNPQAENRYSIYSYGTLAAAVPCGMLVLKTQPAPASPSPAPSSSPSSSGAPAVSTASPSASNTAGLGTGMAAYVKAHNITAACVSGGERFYSSDSSFASFADGTILYYGPSSNNQVVSGMGPWVAAALYNVLAGTQQALGTANGQITALQAQCASANTAATAATAQIADLQAQLAAQQSAVAAQKTDPRAVAAENLVGAIATALSAFQTAQSMAQPQSGTPAPATTTGTATPPAASSPASHL